MIFIILIIIWMNRRLNWDEDGEIGDGLVIYNKRE
jgi:hypothetical protein